jgi:hypothetical protein
MTLSSLNTNKLLPEYVNRGLQGVGNWASVTATTGSPTTGTYTDGNGTSWKYYRWNGSGSVTVTAGTIDLFAISGGAAGATGGGNVGAGGRAVYGIHSLTASTHSISIGGGGAPSGWANSGTASVIGPINTGVSGIGLTASSYTSSITGSSQSYGLQGQSSPRANSGDGGNNSAISGASGTVIIRVPSAFALV